MINLKGILRSTVAAAMITALAPYSYLPAFAHPTGAQDHQHEDVSALDSVTAYMHTKMRSGAFPFVDVMVVKDGMTLHRSHMGEITPDSLYRIYSMTKPITSFAAMMLVEEGVIALDDPIGRYIPAFNEIQDVFAGVAEDGSVTTRKAERQITVRDLLRHTSGFTYGVFTDTPVDMLYREAGLSTLELSAPILTEKLAELPLLADPGQAWIYSVSTDVLGHVLEKATGKKLIEIFQEKLFDPLGMVDTDFHVPEDKWDRLVPNHIIGEDGRLQKMDEEAFGANFKVPPAFQSGGGGLISSMADYMTFASMLANGGEMNGTRFLSEELFAQMTADQLEGADKRGLGDYAAGVGFGFGFGVVIDPGALSFPVHKGDFSWGGYANTTFFIDPDHKMAAVLMSNFLSPGTYLPIRDELRAAIFADVYSDGD